jgi:TPR repeat protein
LAESFEMASTLFTAILKGDGSAAESLVSLLAEKNQETEEQDEEEEEEENAVLTRSAAAGYLILLYGKGSDNVLFAEDGVKCQALAAQYVPIYVKCFKKLPIDHPCTKYLAYILGGCYEEGWGVKKNHRKGFAHYKISGEAGYSWGEFDLGWCYATGTGVSKSLEQATVWFSRAADQGISSAQYLLAVCYEHGRGLVQDRERVAKSYKLAADQGYKLAIDNNHLNSNLMGSG